MTYPKVTIIVPAYNEEKTIEICIQSLLNLTYPKNKYEILIIDNNSTDSTANIIKKYNVRYFKEKKLGVASARNLGIKKAKGEIVAFIDADCAADKDWLFHLVRGFSQNKKIAGVGGDIRALNPKNLIEKYAEVCLFHPKKHMIDNKLQPPFLATANCAYKIELVKKASLFDPSFRWCVDADLSWRIYFMGYKFLYKPKAIVFHEMPKTLTNLIKKYYLYGWWKAKLLSKHRKNLPREKQFFLKNLFSWPKRISVLYKQLPFEYRKEKLIYLLIPILDILTYRIFRLGMIYHGFQIRKGLSNSIKGKKL